MTSEIHGSGFRARARPDGRWDFESASGSGDRLITIEATDLAAIILEPKIDLRTLMRKGTGGQGSES